MGAMPPTGWRRAVARWRGWYGRDQGDDASPREVLAYAIGGVGAGMPNALAGMFTMLILNLEFGVSPVHIGLVMSAFAIWDAVNDPLFAHITDNVRWRWGRRRPFLAIGSILIATFGVLLSWMPAQLGSVSFQLGPKLVAISGHLIWFGAAMFLMDIGTTIFFVPYYALGIELSPTYAGRTRVAATRQFVGGVMGFLSPWFYRFCLIAAFGGVLYGARMLMVILAAVAVASGVHAAVVCRERTDMEKLRSREKESFFRAVRACGRSWPFWRITIMYVILLFIGPVFGAFDGYVTLFYVFKGDKAAMATLGGVIGMLGTTMAMLGIPLFARLASRFGKHNALRVAIGLCMTGHLAKLVLYNPACPYLMLIMPFVYSIGISATFTLLSALQADIVDVDELATGRRREGMFGAVASVVMKSSGALATGIAGFLVVMTGYDVKFGADQPPGTFMAMRLLFSFGPLPFLALVLALLYKYPFTGERMREIHAELKRRHAATPQP
jgi:GPH family glycoside/pentoside/hexuronide:cation symporter